MEEQGPSKREWETMTAEISELKKTIASFQKFTPEEVTTLRRITSLGVAGKLLVICLSAVTVCFLALVNLKAAIKGWLS